MSSVIILLPLVFVSFVAHGPTYKKFLRSLTWDNVMTINLPEAAAVLDKFHVVRRRNDFIVESDRALKRVVSGIFATTIDMTVTLHR